MEELWWGEKISLVPSHRYTEVYLVLHDFYRALV